MKNKVTHIVGIDEAGRGPLAGPVAVGIAVISPDFDWKLIPGVNDSKQVPVNERELIFTEAHRLRKEGRLDFSVTLVAASVIDRIGIVPSVSRAIHRGLEKLMLPCRFVEVRLDGLLRAPEEYIHQKTIVRGDEKEKVIGLASILAKVTRDRLMRRMGSLYPEYGFPEHKGYATRAHREALSLYGLSPLHRKSYCSNVLSY